METEIYSRLREARLEVVGCVVQDEGASVEEAFQRVVHIDALPAQRIKRGSADAARRITTDISALADPDGELPLIARALAGVKVCAASTEGSENWIPEADLSHERP
ncbi:hypothetical protein [Streptomyces sp. NPDC088725]|uniref:hypothetical protein n=1 Tax=Streptomyces sp. NPDC088725 TaxID=3365873 RepID=UPI00382B2CC0